jgi:hypothetical protein
MIIYLSDCPTVSKKVSEKVYKRDDIKKIVEEYNKVCE